MCGTAGRGIIGKRDSNRHPVRRQAVAGLLLTLATLTLIIGGADAQAAVIWPRISLVLRFNGLSEPVQVTHAGDNTGNLYVVEQAGRIRLIVNGTLPAAPFLDISGRVLAGGERGLLGLAFPPGYAAKGYFYVNYTRTPDGSTVIARYRVSADPDAADPNSEEILLVISQPFDNHNGGQLAFGPDGFLYIGMGDGGSGGDPFNNAQNMASLLGKILRIDVESGVVPYGIPPANPFVQTPGSRGEIWALGLRNPWRFSFDRQTGDLYIADVGQNLFEEVDFQPAGSAGGQNYGWNIMEGTHCFGNPACSSAGLVLPVAEYGHGPECSITGGFVYRGTSYPRMQGVYLYADFCSGRFWALKRDGAVWQNVILLTEPRSISSFGEDEAGNLYIADLASGSVYEIVAPNQPPSAPVLIAPAGGTMGAPTTVTFSWQSSADPDGDPVSYRFFLGTDPSFTGIAPVPVASVRIGSSGGPFTLRGFALLLSTVLILAGILFSGRSAKIAAAMILAGWLAFLGNAGCGGGGGGQAAAPPAAPGTITHTTAGLASDTTYYWKVAAEDGLDARESPARSFSTGN